MLLVRTGWTGTQKGAIQPMNALTDQYVRQHLQELRDEGQTHRAFDVDRPSLLRRIATALSGHTGRTSTSGRTIGLALDDDPFRS